MSRYGRATRCRGSLFSATLPEADSSIFAALEAAEYSGMTRGALDRYRRLTRSSDSTIRAGAWLRIARVHRSAGRVDAALRAYRELSKFPAVGINGMPADFVAR